MMSRKKPRIAVVSPFLDKQHGTERPVVEWLSRLADDFEIHLYSQRIEDMDLSRMTWHRVPKLPGPHLLNYIWWFVSNHLWRAWDRWVHSMQYVLVYSPGVNCLDADVISVHIMFAELRRQNLSSMRFWRTSVLDWPRLLHRRIYYRLAVQLERRVYANPEVTLLVIAKRISTGLQEFYGRKAPSPVVYFGLDHGIFSARRRSEIREAARRELQIEPSEFALLLIGNDWLNKGLPLLLEVMYRLRELPLRLLVVGKDDPAPYENILRDKSLDGRVNFLPPRKDVEFYYAAADVYAGPSKEDALPLPPAEAMACGLPVIVTAKCGVSEIMTNGHDSLIIEDPTDAGDLASKIRQLYEDTSFRQRMGERAADTAKRYNWDRSSQEFADILRQALENKSAETRDVNGR